jgi:NAD(P)-dependent dehydrogenase (short-subunit alcohol dehydrogenase family)
MASSQQQTSGLLLLGDDEVECDVAEQKVALVTGASSGIGERTARTLAAQGFTVYGVARRVEVMAGLAEAGVHVLGMDLTDDASVVAGVERVLAEQGRLDVLVNNAGYGSYGAVEEVPLDEARRQFEVNLFGLARLVQLALPGMRERGAGTIVNVSSIGGKIYEPLGAWYHATKFAVEGFSDSLRLELAPFGIDVVIVEPGPIRTEWNTIARTSMVERSADGPYGDLARRLAAVFERIDSSGRSSEPQVVADAIGRAVAARRPRTRYPVGRGAAAIVGARRVLPDRAMDVVLRRALS